MTALFPRTRWHRLIGNLLETLLFPVDISVETEVSVLADPPRADILLLREHIPIVTGGGPDSVKHEEFTWVNTMIGNVKRSLNGTYIMSPPQY